MLKITEDDTAEAARLAQAPEGSQNHALSSLPVTMREHPRGRAIKLPRVHRDGFLVVVPTEHHPSLRERAEGEPIRFDGSWDCIVIGSTVEDYPVGGYDICVSYAELRRGEPVDVLMSRTPSPQQDRAPIEGGARVTLDLTADQIKDLVDVIDTGGQSIGETTSRMKEEHEHYDDQDVQRQIDFEARTAEVAKVALDALKEPSSEPVTRS